MSVKVRGKVKGSGMWWLFMHHQGKRKTMKIGDKGEATRLGKILEGELAAGKIGLDEVNTSERVKSVKEYTDIWLATTVASNLKPSTQADYKCIVRKHIKTASFASKPVDKMTKGTVKRFLRSKLASGLSVSTVTHIKNVLGGLFQEAIDDEVITANPAHVKWRSKQQTKKDNVRKPKITPLEVDEVNALLGTFNMEEPTHYPLVLLLVNTGCRIGEAVALQWQDIDFGERVISVGKNFVRNHIEDSTKNGEDRKVDMTGQLVRCLKQLKKGRAGEALKFGSGSIDKDWLFPSRIRTSNKPLNYDRWRRDIFYPMLEKAGLRRIRVHDLRHTYASIMISTNCTLIYIRDQLGHSSITITADTYGHLLRGNKEKPVDVLDGLLIPTDPYATPKKKKALNE